jgi:hypothetical protein
VISRDEAAKIAGDRITKMSRDIGLDLVLQYENTVDFDLGWIFFWNSKKYLETKDFAEALAGNAPIIVDRRDGSIHQAPTALGTADRLIQWYHGQDPSRQAL